MPEDGKQVVTPKEVEHLQEGEKDLVRIDFEDTPAKKINPDPYSAQTAYTTDLKQVREFGTEDKMVKKLTNSPPYKKKVTDKTPSKFVQ